MKIKLRKEELLCSNCGKPRTFYYLSDYSYGERLVLINHGTGYAYMNMIEDDVYDDFSILLKCILDERSIVLAQSDFAEVLNSLFGISCDNIGGVPIDFSYNMEKCLSCGSVKFDSKIDGAEKMAEVDLPVITHESWNLINDEEKRNAIKDLLDKFKSARN